VDLLELAVGAARAAGDVLLERFGEPVRGLNSKSTPTDLVSDADREAEQLIAGRLRAARPDDAILGEEGSSARGTSGLRWVVDPLDGTVNFLFGLPHWCVSIAVEDERGGVCGVVHDACRAEIFTAVRGEGAHLNGERVRVSETGDIAQALIATGFAYDAGRRAAQAGVLTRVLPAVRDIRRFGSAALDLAWTACGRFDGYYEAPVMHWDRAAGTLLVAEAGGLVGEFADPEPGVVASGRGIYETLCRLVVGAD
jgi:myo-inositol-1(or 4)-monophosphatase